ITEISETIQGQTRKFSYLYDVAGRLTDMSRNDTLLAVYTYDANGNRLSLDTPAETRIGTYDSQDHQLSYGNASYSYTRHSDLLMKIVATDTTRYTYDAFGNLVSVRLPNGTLIEYVIDGQNRRVGKKINGSLTRKWLYENQLNVVAELDGADNVESRFVYGMRPNVPDYLIKGGMTYRIVSDHLGNVRLVVNTTNGAVAQRLDYDEFGHITNDTNPGFQPFGFAGGVYDEQTKLVRFGARDYDAFTGRWTAKDPILFDGGQTNLYVYVGNNPVNFIDPMGLGDLCNKSKEAVVVVAWALERERRVRAGHGGDFEYTVVERKPEKAVLLEPGMRTPSGTDWDFYGVGNLQTGFQWYKFSVDAFVDAQGRPQNASLYPDRVVDAMQKAGKGLKPATDVEKRESRDVLGRVMDRQSALGRKGEGLGLL
ncbi:MAG: RHS repeat domain-containing protein, partial [Nitrososphaera sp.]